MRSYFLVINGTILLVCAVFGFNYFKNELPIIASFDSSLLIILLLFLPLIDRSWSGIKYSGCFSCKQLTLFIAALIVVMALMGLVSISVALNTIFLVALPEEWFFRAYFMQRLETLVSSRLHANIMTSLFFSALHVPTQGWFGLTVFFPSLFLGYLYQKNKDLVLVVLLHAIFNIIFVIYIINESLLVIN